MKFNISKATFYKNELIEVRKESLKYKFVNVKYNKQLAAEKQLNLIKEIAVKMFGL